MINNIGEILKDNPLVKLIQEENFIGWIYHIDYDAAYVMTNDLWKYKARGVPHNCFLIAASFKPDEFQNVSELEQEVILLRVVGSVKLPQDDDLVRTKIDYFQQQNDIYEIERDYDDITKNQLQFGGLECRVIGTFFIRDNELWLGSDLESFAVAARLNVYRPRGEALELIINHVDPMQRQKVIEEAKQLGIKGQIQPFQIGTIRYTSTDRLHRNSKEDKVPFKIQPSDFLARRTAVLGMTRTGKSNLIKQTVAVVKRVADEGRVNIGQIIFDINGEYANANQQDQGSIVDVYPNDTIRYRMIPTSGFEELQNNFYSQINEGFLIIKNVIKENKDDGQDDVKVFLNTSFDKPDPQEKNAYNRWMVRVAAYKAMLFKAGFEPPQNYKVYFTASKNIQESVNSEAGKKYKDPKNGLTLSEAIEWFLAARDANKKKELKSSSGKPWLDDDTKAIINMMANKNSRDTFIKGYRVIIDAKKFHSPRRTQEVGDEIYQHLSNGKIVILDLSVGEASLREKISKQIAHDIFNKSMYTFIEGKIPPNIVIYVEEAHNLIGRNMDLTETWPRIAKEGAKYRIALVYATQEVSSVHPNILFNTENWFVSHINNDHEIKELTKFYDFADFRRSLIRAQDVGFARVKTLSSPFVVPVQIDKFDPELEKKRVSNLKSNR